MPRAYVGHAMLKKLLPNVSEESKKFIAIDSIKTDVAGSGSIRNDDEGLMKNHQPGANLHRTGSHVQS